MELFLLFAIAITIVAFIPIVISKPVPSLNTNGLLELESPVSQLDFISPESNTMDLIPINIQNSPWEIKELNQLQELFAIEEM